MAKILLLYTTREGQTYKIMAKIAEVLSSEYQCDLIELQKNQSIDLSQYHSVLMGTSIRYGYYSKIMRNFINLHATELNQKLTGFFGVNVVARKPHKNTPETNLYTRKFLAKILWKPTLTAVFAGALYYPRYNWLDRNMIRFIMWIGKGETDTSKPIIEYTNWQQVDKFAHDFLMMLKQ